LFHLISKVQYFYKSHWLSWLKCFFVSLHKNRLPVLCKFNEAWLEKDCYKRWLKWVGSDQRNGVTKLTRPLRILCETGRIHESKCDTIISEYGKYLNGIVSNDSQSFVPSKNRLDELMYSTLADRKEFSELWAVVQILLLLSHGHTTVERGFSVNKNVTTENLSMESLIAQRLIMTISEGLEELLRSSLLKGCWRLLHLPDKSTGNI